MGDRVGGGRGAASAPRRGRAGARGGTLGAAPEDPLREGGGCSICTPAARDAAGRGRICDSRRDGGTIAPVKVLLVEDSESLQRSLGIGLVNSGFVLDRARDGYEARAFLDAGGHDVVVLDLMIPGIDGFELLARMRRRGDATPVLVLSARDRVEDRVRGLDLGADDYLVKPFAFDELVSRLRALGRRARPEVPLAEPVLRHGALALDTHARRASWAGRELALTPSELTLLETLLRGAGRVHTHEHLIGRVYPSGHAVGRNALEAHVSTLRRKLRAAGAPRVVETRRGFGYVVARAATAGAAAGDDGGERR